MSKSFRYSLLVLLLVVAACQKYDNDTSGEIVINLYDGDLEISTKATAVTSLPSSLYWGMTYSNGSAKASTTSKSVSSSKISSGYYQTASPTTYIHYAANANFTAGGDMTVSNNGTDIIAGKVSSNSTTPSLALGHIFARTGSLTLNIPSGYSSSSVSWQIIGKSTVNGTAGTYNMSSQSWTSAFTKLSSYTSLTATSDYYLIPGTYTVKVSFTLTKGDFSKAYTQTGDITLYAGKINNITATTSTAEAVEIVFSTSVNAWTSSSTDIEFDGQ